MKKYKIVKIEWDDTANHRGWNRVSKAKDFGTIRCVSTGVLVKVKKGCIGVTHTCSEERDIAETIVIPRKVVHKVEILSTFKV